MAIKLDSAGTHVVRKAGEAEVASCVAGIIEAFTNGLNIFKRLRERRKKRKTRKEPDKPDKPDPTSTAEHQLSKSLRRGPEEVAESYAEYYFSGLGPRFAKGDSIAHASLAETLIRLNTGLVAIIATFLNHDSKGGKSQLDLDYKSLTHLSDVSRREAIHSLTQLYQRLSQSQLQLNFAAPPCPRCGTSKHHDCSSRSSSPEKMKRKHSSSSRQRSSGHVVTRMPIRHGSSNQPQLVVMRPKTTRKSSSSGNSSGAVKSASHSVKSPLTSRDNSPVASPQLKKLQMAPQLPLYVPIEPFELESGGATKSKLESGASKKSSSKPRVDSFDDSRSPPWTEYPYMLPKSSTPKPSSPKPSPVKHVHEPTPKLPSFTSTPRRSSTPIEVKPPVPSKPAHLSPEPVFPSPATLAFRRRLDKATPSSYTFASDSTKMGEIPQRNWHEPFDYEEAERLNAEAAINGYPNAPTGAENKTEKKKKRFGFMRRDA
ncbi:hypothetical protein PTMSG1_09247 [Pyrenophora teres f. maculata]|nr:hypothetical protein PTMSG1_09247 [Pyrenophora teres f. maculata]